MTDLTPHDFDTRLTALGNALADAERAVNDLALPAASGNADAVDRLAKAQAKKAQLEADRDILQRARAAAATKADAAALAEAEAARAAAKARAEGLAARLVGMAQRADALAEEFRSIAHTMPAVEQDLWAALREAGEDVSDGTIGRRGLANYAVSAVTQAHLPLRPRGCAEVAAVAWGFLLADKDI